MRPGEVDGQDYFFVDQATFEAMIADHVFLEHATVFGRHYGTSRAWVENQLVNDIDVVLEIDWQGARQIKKLFPSAVLIFILPPSMEALMERLRNRKQDDAQTIVRRMQAAKDEMQHFGEFDYLVVNDQFEKALEDLRDIVRSARLKTTIQREKLQGLLEGLVGVN